MHSTLPEILFRQILWPTSVTTLLSGCFLKYIVLFSPLSLQSVLSCTCIFDFYLSFYFQVGRGLVAKQQLFRIDSRIMPRPLFILLIHLPFTEEFWQIFTPLLLHWMSPSIYILVYQLCWRNGCQKQFSYTQNGKQGIPRIDRETVFRTFNTLFFFLFLSFISVYLPPFFFFLFFSFLYKLIFVELFSTIRLE